MAEAVLAQSKLKTPSSFGMDILTGSIFETVIDGGFSFADEAIGIGLAGLDVGDWIASILIYLRSRRHAGLFIAIFAAWEATNFLPVSLIPVIGTGVEIFTNIFPCYAVLKILTAIFAWVMPDSTLWQGSETIAYKWKNVEKKLEGVASTFGIDLDDIHTFTGGGILKIIFAGLIGFYLWVNVHPIAAIIAIIILLVLFTQHSVSKKVGGAIEKLVAGGSYAEDAQNIRKYRQIAEILKQKINEKFEKDKEKLSEMEQKIQEIEGENLKDKDMIENINAQISELGKKPLSNADDAHKFLKLCEKIDLIEEIREEDKNKEKQTEKNSNQI